jgi:NAD(P)-dependent dehydrogenase (short-subunit alcohol dehydrogenase family)
MRPRGAWRWNTRSRAKRPGIALGQYPSAQVHPKKITKTADVKDTVDAIIHLAEADQVTGEVLHVDGGIHVGGCQRIQVDSTKVQPAATRVVR